MSELLLSWDLNDRTYLPMMTVWGFILRVSLNYYTWVTISIKILRSIFWKVKIISLVSLVKVLFKIEDLIVYCFIEFDTHVSF